MNTEFAIEWILPEGKIVQGAGRHPTREAAEQDVMLSFLNYTHWSREYRIVELPALETKHRHDEP